MEGKTFRILIDGRDYDVELAINKTSDDIARMLPLRLFMQAYSDIEYYAELPDKPFFDEKVAITQAEKNALMYCREYNALVVVCRDHRDIFREVPVGKIIGGSSWFDSNMPTVSIELIEV